MEISFIINGTTYKVPTTSTSATTSLNTFIREHAQLRGTKFMCLEGGCGACIVTATGFHPVTKEKNTWAINSCLVSVFSCHNLEITTIEGVGSKSKGYHAIQKRFAHLNGTQCGYCSPGMVMNMYGLQKGKSKNSMEDVENSFGGNICRCTGYRPILDAFKGLAFDASDELKLMYPHDIEDLKLCSKTGQPCSGICYTKKPKEKISLILQSNQDWHKVYKIEEIFTIFSGIDTKPYILVSGNTAHGVYRRNHNLQVFIDVTDVEELRNHQINNQLQLGANVSLTETMQIFREAAEKNKNFEYLLQLIKHIDLIANVPVRNIGSIAGNLSIKNSHNEFPSDMFLMLETSNAKITITENIGKSKEYSILDFISLPMTKLVITKITLPQYDPAKFIYRSYKIMPRAQNAHAYVNAGFLFELNETKNTVVSARICFGGIRPDFTHAEETEKFLIGKNLYSNETLKAAFKILNDEINPDSVLPDASPEFRRKLAVSLFYKFVLNTCPNNLVKPEYKSGGEVLKRDLSSGTQTFETVEKNYPLTKPVPKLEALIQSSGEAPYANDLPTQPKELWGAFVLADQVHSKIDSFDTKAALDIPGVVAFFSAKDIPGKNTFMPLAFGGMEIEEILCSGEVLFHGQPAGIILADSFDLANYVVSLVKIVYEKISNESGGISALWNYYMGENRTGIIDAPPIMPTMQDVFNHNATDRIIDIPIHTKEASEIGLNTTHKTVGRFEIGSQYHFTMETQTCVCLPTEFGMKVFSSTQWMDHVQVAIAEALNVQTNIIDVEVRRVGGAYGSKISRSTQIACAAALACHLLNRPVRFVLTIEANMAAIGKRWACVNDYTVETDDKGKIQKLTNVFYEDGGSSLNENIILATEETFKNSYDHSTWTIKPTGIKTDSPSHTWCRAPATTEGMAMIENIMEHIARVTNQTPESVRIINMPANSLMKSMYEDFLKSIDIVGRRAKIDEFNKVNRWRKKGIASSTVRYPIEYGFTFPAFVSIYHNDGTVAITHGGIEMGQGINTKAAQVAAHILGIPLEMVNIKPSDTISSPNAVVTGGSIGSEGVSFAVKRACEIILERIKPVRDELKNPTWPELTQACFFRSIDLSAHYAFTPEDAKAYDVLGCAAAEMEVDLLTGNILLTRVDILEDTGESMSPLIDIGQIEGAFVMGIGYWLTENLVFNRENGELLSNRTWTYKPPGVKDIPIDFRVKLVQTGDKSLGVLRSKATGEPATCMSVVTIFALRYALDSARKDTGAKEIWYQLGAPSTPETVFQTSEVNYSQYQI